MNIFNTGVYVVAGVYVVNVLLMAETVIYLSFNLKHMHCCFYRFCVTLDVIVFCFFLEQL